MHHVPDVEDALGDGGAGVERVEGVGDGGDGGGSVRGRAVRAPGEPLALPALN